MSVLFLRFGKLKISRLLLYAIFDFVVTAAPLTNEFQKLFTVVAGSLSAAAACYLLHAHAHAHQHAHTCSWYSRECVVCVRECLVIYHMPTKERANETCQVYKNTVNIKNSIEINKYITATRRQPQSGPRPFREAHITTEYAMNPQRAIKNEANNQLSVSESFCLGTFQGRRNRMFKKSFFHAHTSPYTYNCFHVPRPYSNPSACH